VKGLSYNMYRYKYKGYILFTLIPLCIQNPDASPQKPSSPFPQFTLHTGFLRARPHPLPQPTYVPRSYRAQRRQAGQQAIEDEPEVGVWSRDGENLQRVGGSIREDEL
jgi:hypothetical protein